MLTQMEAEANTKFSYGVSEYLRGKQILELSATRISKPSCYLDGATTKFQSYCLYTD
jgi:hypothetical protein